ncbi:MAG: right-handed parallel beta-helix repeat-containing protein [Phycisphaerales bacterium]|nr:right-handed parallel beta-helix repeat-containing protein [Phycisphaerales bacterium]
MKCLLSILAAGMLAVAGCSVGQSDPFMHGRLAAEPDKGGPVLEPPTLHCLGAYWLVRGDENRMARVEVRYRKLGDVAWNRAPDMIRVIQGPFSNEGDHIKPPAVMIHEGFMFAGSVLGLEPDTEYELKYNLISPKGGSAEKILKTKTFVEPKEPAGMRVRHIVPGNGGGSGTAQDPFKGFAAADADAKPGDLFLVHQGTYDSISPTTLRHDGELGKPIIYRGAGDGEASIDAKSTIGPPPGFRMEGKAVSLSGRHDIWFENLSMCNAYTAFHAPNCMRLVIRRCHIHHAIEGIHSAPNPYPSKEQAKEFPKPPGITQGYFFISDNLITGVVNYPATPEQWGTWPESRGIWVTGPGNIMCYNRVHHWKDGIDVDESIQSIANDIHNNEVSECFDDGCEMDGSDRNNRLYTNRFVNCHTGLSFQPIHGGPIYAFQNAVYNVKGEFFKFHNNPSGCIVFHNTCTKNGGGSGPLLMCWTSRSINGVHLFNNLYLGNKCTRAVDYDTPLFNCSSDYNGYGGYGYKPEGKPEDKVFMKWAGVMYKNIEDVRARSPYEAHCVIVDPTTAFASGLQPPSDFQVNYDYKTIDMRLAPNCKAVGAGIYIPGYETVKKPTLGAYEPNVKLPHYGPRAVR